MTSVTLTRHIAAPLEAVFEAVSTPAGIAAWWGPDAGPVLHAEMDLRVGGHYRARFRMLDGTEHECTGRFLEVSPPHRLTMTWRWVGGREAEGESRIEISLRASENGTTLTFTHALLPDDAKTAEGHKVGWTGSLAKLERYLSEPRCRTGESSMKSGDERMPVDNALASLAVKDIQVAGQWYARLLGQEGSQPMPEVQEWSFPRGGGLQVYQAPERAGQGSCTLAVSDIEAAVRTLASMGVDVSHRTNDERVRTVMVTDPDGNHLAFAQAIDPSFAR